MGHPTQQIRFCTSRDGTRIAYAICGSGPPIVRTPHPCSHLNFDWDSAVWSHWLALFSRRHTLVRYDLRGCGLSDREGVKFSAEGHLEDLEAVVDAAGLDRFALFGADGGGITAMMYAARHPERVSHLMLIGCFLNSRLARHRTGPQAEQTELWLKAIELGFELNNPGLLELYTSIRMPDAGVEQQRSFNELMRLATTPANFTNFLRAAFRENEARELAPKIRCPTIVLHAREDGAIPFDEGRALAAHIPSAHFVPLESRNHHLAGHEPAWTQVVNAFDAFLPAPTANDRSNPLLDELTRREQDVLELVAQGLDNGTIAKRLGISERTARNHVSIIFSKLGVNRRAQAIVRARDAGFGKKT